jgi:hypothetical protein
MRRFATFNLFYLAFVAASALSTVHIDHEGSHQKLCVANQISATCHADVPHEHEATHAGQESLFEHTFENGSLEKSVSYVAPDVVTVALFDTEAATPVVVLTIAKVGSTGDTPPLYPFVISPQSSRAPPAV